MAAMVLVELGQTLKVRHNQIGMIRTRCLFPGLKLALMKRPSFRISALQHVEHGQTAERASHVEVVRTQRFFPDCERALKKGLGFRESELRQIKPGEAVELRAHRRMLGT